MASLLEIAKYLKTLVSKAGSGKTGYYEITMSLDTNAYADGDVLADTQILSNILAVDSGTGIIHSIQLLDKDDQAGALDIVFFRTNVSLGTENSAVSISDANANEILGIVEIAATDYVDLVNSQSVTKTNLGIGCKGSGDKHLYIGLISRDTKTYTASGITIKVTVLLDA